MYDSTEKFEALEARLASLEAEVARSAGTRSRLVPRWVRRLLPVAIMIALPVGVVASDKFSDVPTDSPYHGAIGELADAGITAGCTPTKFCPDASVTREQMAVFLYRSLGRVGWHTVGYGGVPPTSSLTDRVGTRMTAPARGWFLVFPSVTFKNQNAAGCPCRVTISSRNKTNGAVGYPWVGEIGNASIANTVGKEAVLPMQSVDVLPADKGYNYLYTQVSQSSGTALLDMDVRIAAVWVPFGGDGAARP
jgi:hypothetical protein